MNGTDLCDQIITRTKIANGKTEAAVLDFYVVCKSILALVHSMTIEDNKKLTRFSKTKIVESDHSPIILNLNIKPPENSTKRMEIYNFRSKECLAVFKKETSKSSNLSDCFKTSKTFHNQVTGWKLGS